MASIYQRGARWYLRYRDERGRWRDRVWLWKGKALLIAGKYTYRPLLV